MTGLCRYIMCLGCIVIVALALYPPRIYEGSPRVAPRAFVFSKNFYKANYEEWDHQQHADGATSFHFRYDAAEFAAGRFACELIIVAAITGLLCCLTANRRFNHRQQYSGDARDG